MIQQLSVFIENTPGRVNALFQGLSEQGINVHAFTIADTKDFGIARLICDTPKKACTKLRDAGFRVSLTDVAAIYVPDRPGGLGKLLKLTDQGAFDIQYAYCFSMPQNNEPYAIDVMRTDNIKGLEDLCVNAGFSIVPAKEIYKLD